MRRKRELDISQADEQFRANPTFQALVANWHSLSAAEKGRLMQEILRATGRPRTDLARALGMDEANVRHYIRVSAEDSTLNRPVADSPQSVAERSSAKDTQTANKRAPTSTGSISVSAPDPNPIVQNSQLRRMAGTSSQTNSSSIGRQLPYAERPATDQPDTSNNPSSQANVSSPRTDQHKPIAVVAVRKAQASIPASMPIFRPAEQSALDLRAQAAVQTTPIPGPVTPFSASEESKIKHIDGYVGERIKQLGSDLLALSLSSRATKVFRSKTSGG